MHYPVLNELPFPLQGKKGWPWTEESPQLPDKMPDEKPWPKISIVTPSYNQGQFIEETIRSVLLQGYPDLEFIIIDGGSTDNSLEIIKKYEPWLSYWVSEPDRGQSHAINKGWAKAKGDILAWLNSDDYYFHPDVFREVAELFHSAPKAEVAYGQTQKVDSGGKFLRLIEGCSELEKVLLTSASPFPQMSVFIRRSALEKVGTLNEDLHFGMDWDLYIRMLTQGVQAVGVKRTWSSFRHHKTSKTSLNISELRFNLDNLYTLQQVFRSTNNASLMALRNRALAWSHFRVGQGYLRVHQSWMARRYLIKAVWLWPLIAFEADRLTLLRFTIGNRLANGFLRLLDLYHHYRVRNNEDI